MTHYDVSYEGLRPTRARWKALLDTRNYLGRERYIAMRAILRTESPHVSADQLSLPLSLIGVQGFPVRALWESYIRARDPDWWHDLEYSMRNVL